MSKEEIRQEDLAQYSQQFNAIFAQICTSTQFRSSLKGCDFLRHVFQHALDGRADELKERLIGIALLGRSTTYDTGSDAGVRVRANDVRKRLNAYNAEHEDAMFSLDLPPGTYIPRFLREAVAPANHPQIDQPDLVVVRAERVAPISTYALAAPTVAALFLCMICVRWQIAQEHPFTAFWESALLNHRTLLYLPPSDHAGGEEYFSRERLEAAAPLLDLAGQFHMHLVLTPSSEPSLLPGDVLITMASATEVTPSELKSAGFAQRAHSAMYRLAVESTPAGRQIVDTEPQLTPFRLPGRAALLTIANGAQHSIQIDGTDDAAIASMLHQVSERDSFPEVLADSFRSGTVIQAVFPLSQGAQPMVLHETLPGVGITTAQAQ
jgi:hypothetical protein